MPGYLIGGKEVGPTSVVNPMDDPGLRLGAEDSRPRTGTWVRNIVLHTRWGVDGGALVATPPADIKSWPMVYGARTRSDSLRKAGAHITIGAEGEVACHCDLLKVAAYHAGACNEGSIGVEMYQERDGTMYLPTLLACVRVCDFLTGHFRIPRVVEDSAKPKAALCKGAKDFEGIMGHRACSRSRGPGDPGDLIFQLLRGAGYSRVKGEP
jgi:hypothetical protein